MFKEIEGMAQKRSARIALCWPLEAVFRVCTFFFRHQEATEGF